MRKTYSTLIAVALAASAGTALAAEAPAQYAIHTEVIKAGVVVHTSVDHIAEGGTASIDNTKFEEHEVEVSTTCRVGLARWLKFYKPACDEPERKFEQIQLGFKADISAHAAPNGKIITDINWRYAQFVDGKPALEDMNARTLSESGEEIRASVDGNRAAIELFRDGFKRQVARPIRTTESGTSVSLKSGEEFQVGSSLPNADLVVKVTTVRL
ncbi:TPA: hypothetical protein NIA45_004700 [Pseudomonas aeruginosa]|nr:hypothetical protein [Pseudomonas aeruginosa]